MWPAVAVRAPLRAARETVKRFFTEMRRIGVNPAENLGFTACEEGEAHSGGDDARRPNDESRR